MRQTCPKCGIESKNDVGVIRKIGPYVYICSNCNAIGVSPLHNKRLFYWGLTWDDVRKLMLEDNCLPEWMKER